MTVMEQQLQVWGDAITASVKVAGEGPPLVYLHGAGGLVWDESLDRLAEDFTVYAPQLPGTAEGHPTAIYSISGLQDLVLYYLDVLDALELERPVLVGASFGGMLAAEIAATSPSVVSRLVLISPAGLWRDDAPIPNWTIMTEPQLRSALFHDPDGPTADEYFTPDPDPAVQAAADVRATWAYACSGKFLWPIPERGLRNRLHRVKSPTLVVWGESDRLISPEYASDFTEAIAGARLELIAEGGHALQSEKPEALVGVIKGFLASRVQ